MANMGGNREKNGRQSEKKKAMKPKREKCIKYHQVEFGRWGRK
jgi:hypothetical protein